MGNMIDMEQLAALAMRGSPARLIDAPKTGRKLRSPDQDWHLRFRPFQLVPFMCHPVIPGETMKSAFLQARTLTDPIKNPLIGWWLEHYMFYVPWRATDASDDFQAMALDPAFGALANNNESASTSWYHSQSANPAYYKLATKAVVDEFFRNDGEDWLTNASLDDYPQVGLMKSRAFESMALDSGTDEPDTIPGDGFSDEDGLLDQQVGSLASTFAGAYDAWQQMVASKMIDVTFEDFLKSHGVNTPARPSDEPLPELLRYSKEWTYPSKAVDESDGSISSACHWSSSVRADKDRFFKEPGFILGLVCATPKVYFSNQTQAVIDSMNTGLDWLPAMLHEQAFTSLRSFTSDGSTTGNGPLGSTPSADYWLDIRDLFVNGDQFVNFALTETDAGLVALPDSGPAARFVSDTDVNNLFSGTAKEIHEDGVCRLNILGRVTDMTP